MSRSPVSISKHMLVTVRIPDGVKCNFTPERSYAVVDVDSNCACVTVYDDTEHKVWLTNPDEIVTVNGVRV